MTLYKYIQMNKTFNLIVITLLALNISCLPFREQIALANSLQVGRKEDPTTWGCVGCQDYNRPLSTHIVKEDVLDVVAIVSVYEEYTVLAFRYTATLKNVWQDLLWAIQVQDEHSPKGCKVQKQYEIMWNAVRQPIFSDLLNSPKTHRLIVTGISLGGGLANLAYVDIHDEKLFDTYEIITFGAPRVGNKKWAKWFDSITTSDRFFIKGDPIAVLPRCLTPICNYRQPQVGISCNKRKQVCTKKCKKDDHDYQDDQFDMQSSMDYMKDIITTANNKDQDVNGIIDHVVGYKKLYNYTLVGC